MHGIVELNSNLTLDYYHIGDNGIIDNYCDPSVRSMLFKRSPFADCTHRESLSLHLIRVCSPNPIAWPSVCVILESCHLMSIANIMRSFSIDERQSLRMETRMTTKIADTLFHRRHAPIPHYIQHNYHTKEQSEPNQSFLFPFPSP
jgi:hypothetical protein